MTCIECERKDAEPGSDTCFRCRVASVGVTWRGGGYTNGRHNFAARTNAEYINEHVPEGAVHTGSRGYTG